VVGTIIMNFLTLVKVKLTGIYYLHFLSFISELIKKLKGKNHC